MKTKLTIIISCALVAGIIISGLAFADIMGTRGQRGSGFHRPHKDFDMMLLVRYQQENMMVQTLSDLTRQSVETIQAKLKDQKMRTVMQELNIDREAFHTAMRINFIDLIQKSAKAGTITPEQAKDILAKMKIRSQRRELMSELIEKGLQDGTLTQEQAQMLMHKPR